MAFIIETPNPFEPLTGIKKHRVSGGVTIRQWLQSQFPGFTEFEMPTICVVNGEAVLREGWDYCIEEGDVINFIAIPQGPLATIIILVVAVALSVAMALILPVDAPITPGSAPASDPVFTTKGQANAVRLGEPIEVNYGRNRLYPSYAARPYFEYINNDQFQFSLFCLGHGEYDVESILIGDTSIDSYQEVEYEVVPPGSPVTLFPTNVYTSPEAGGQTLYAPNEAEYTADGWIGPFPTSPSGTLAMRVQVDFSFPKGGYKMLNSGDLASLSTTLVVEARPIDNAGIPTGPYSVTLNPTVSWKTTTPQRITLEYTPTPGRYEVRVRRTSNKDLSHRAGHDVVWEGLRSYIDVNQSFGNVTLLAVKIRATNNLNSRTQQRFNVIATRKLAIRGTGGFETEDPLVATRSIVWAFVDVFRSLYGARLMSESFFDWETLTALDAFYESRNEHFDFSFRDPITVWEAAHTIARAGRAVPLLSGSLISIKRDGPQDIPVALFGPDNMLQGSFEWGIRLWELEDHDSLSVEYTDATTGYKQEIVTCVLPGGTADNPENLRLIGVQDRAHAYREGLYILAARKYQRENITFETGLEGYIPTFGDLIAISHDVPNWGQSGYVVEAEAGAEDQYLLTVSEPLEFSTGQSHQMLLRGRSGEMIGPVAVHPTDKLNRVIADFPGQPTGGIDFLLDGNTEPMIFLFGVSGRITKYAKIVRIDPQKGERVRITAVNDAPVIHSFDSLTPPALASSPLIYPPDLPVISALYVTQIDGPLQIIQISWSAAFGAQYYLVETSEDNVAWQLRAETVRSSVQLQAHTGLLYIRVAAVNEGQGLWKETSYAVGLLPGVEVYIAWEFTELGVRWWEVLNVAGYRVEIRDNSSTDLVLIRSRDLSAAERSFVYTADDAIEDGYQSRELLVSVDVLLEGVDGMEPSGVPVLTSFSNALPSAPTGMNAVYSGEIFETGVPDSVGARYLLSWALPADMDIYRLKVWMSTTPGFTPAPWNEVASVEGSAVGPDYLPSSLYVTVPRDPPGSPTETQYWRVGVFDPWGEEISSNVSTQQVITAL